MYVFCWCLYIHKATKKRIFILLQALFGVNMLDLIFNFTFEIIFVPFVNLGNHTEYFLYYILPKTIIYVLCSCLYVLIMYELLQKKPRIIGFVPVIAELLVILCTQFIPSYSITNWIFYATDSLCSIVLCLIFFYYIRQSMKFPEEYKRICKYKNIVWFFLLCGIASFLEDTIFADWLSLFFKQYFPYFQRTNVSEVISTVILVAIVIYYCKRIDSAYKSHVIKGECTDQSGESSQQQENNQLNWNNQLEKLTSDYGLTKREEEILQLVLRGASNQEIADELYITIGTVKTHIHNIYRKLNITKRSQLMGNYIKYMPQK